MSEVGQRQLSILIRFYAEIDHYGGFHAAGLLEAWIPKGGYFVDMIDIWRRWNRLKCARGTSQN